MLTQRLLFFSGALMSFSLRDRLKLRAGADKPATTKARKLVCHAKPGNGPLVLCSDHLPLYR